MKRTKIVIDNAKKEQLETEREFFLQLPNYLKNIYDRLEKLERKNT